LPSAFLLISVLLLTLSCPVFADEPPAKLWTEKETALTATLLVAAAGVSLADEDIRREFQENRGGGADTLADGLDTLGHPATGLGIAASLWGVGQWRGDRQLAETGKLALQAVLLADVTALTLKTAIGRQRPGEEDDPSSFRPFSLKSDHDALPSGHASSSFALAAVLSRRSDSAYAPYLYYALASLVAVARVYNDDHWASDVISGVLVGELSGRLVLARQSMKNAGIPTLQLDGERAMLGWRMEW